MVKLVQTIEMLPTCDLANQPMIQFHYAFALNRWPQICIVWYIPIQMLGKQTFIPYSLLISGTHAFLFACVNTDETAQEIESKRCVWCCRFFSHVSTLHLTCSACVAASIRTSSSTLTARTPRTGTTPSSGEWVKWASWSAQFQYV